MIQLDPIALALKAPVTKANLKNHIFVCTGASCTRNQSELTLNRFWEVLAEKGLLYGKRGSMEGTVMVTTCGSVGLCTIGPAVLVYPEGIWYYGVSPDDVEEIVDSHIINGRPVERLMALQFE
ncbi:MAG TPA: (2Fe-2S) ferredoxin domain-containing protein [Oculatellaceae cyanobacterium]|jgi:(2Fe-2S) ferredoxin